MSQCTCVRSVAWTGDYPAIFRRSYSFPLFPLFALSLLRARPSLTNVSVYDTFINHVLNTQFEVESFLQVHYLAVRLQLNNDNLSTFTINTFLERCLSWKWDEVKWGQLRLMLNVRWKYESRFFRAMFARVEWTHGYNFTGSDRIIWRTLDAYSLECMAIIVWFYPQFFYRMV